MRHSPIIVSGLILGTLILAACGSSRLSTRTASEKLKPVAPLPERERLEMPVNLYIRIDNVADAGSSYRNYVKLFINGKEIAPDVPENNLQSTYEYSLRLQPGIYKVKAEYHVVGFWKERVYPILTDEPVKVLPRQRTELRAALEKEIGGFPRQKETLFSIRYLPLTGAQSFSQELPPEPPSRPQVVSKEPVAPGLRVSPPPHPTPPSSGHQELAGEKIQLQINTVPIGADVFVDDRFVGQAPVRITVTRGEQHVVQVSRRGFQDYLKILNARDLQGRDSFQLVVRLEPRE